MTSSSISCKCGDKTYKKSVAVAKFAEFTDPKAESVRFLCCWSINTKLANSDSPDISALKLTKNEKLTLSKLGEQFVRDTAFKSHKEYIAMRRDNSHPSDFGNGSAAGSRRKDNLADIAADSVELPADNGLPAETTETIAVSDPAEPIPCPQIQLTYGPFNLELPDLEEAGCSTVLFGSSKSGKTTLMKDIIKLPEIKDADNIKFLLSPNVHAKIYKDIDKKIIKLDHWDDRLVSALHKIQKKTKNKYIFTIIIDDCILNKNSGKIMELFLTLRNSKISTIMLLQSTTLLNRNSRFNVNNFVFKKCNNDEAIRQNMDFFLGSYDPFKGLPMEEKMSLYREITNNYGFIYLDALNGSLTLCKGK